MKSLLRVVALLALVLSLVPAGFAGNAESSKKTAKHPKAAAKKAPATKASAKSDAAVAVAAVAPVPKAAKKSNASPPEAPKWTPMPATTGTLGLFTVESAETLPKGGWSFSAFGNKVARNPGQINVTTIGWSVAAGLTDRLTAYVEMDAHNHVHIGNRNELSLDTPTTGAFQPFDNTLYRSILPCSPPSVPCGAPAYVEDYPFAFANGGGIGTVTIGLKFNLLSQDHGHWLSLALRNEAILPTRYALADLVDNQGQSGRFNYNVALSASRHMFGNSLVAMFNAGYRFTPDPNFTVFIPSAGNAMQKVHVTMADQVHLGAGVLVFPEKRIQLMNEYTGEVFVGAHTPNTSFGARDPVDAVWGFRFYPVRWAAFDAGYRVTINLANHHRDRSGFVFKLSTVLWPEKEKAPDTVTASCSLDKSSVVAESGAVVGASVRATDSYNHPLNYTWTATGGSVEGSGADVRWNSAGAGPGTYAITARADDGQGNTASCSGNVTVEPKPLPPPPTMSCSVDRSSVLAGERVNVAASVNDRSGSALSYSWQTTGGQIIGSGANVQLDTTGLSPGSYTITGRVQNGVGGAADCSTGVTIQAPPPPPQASKLNECLFKENSARVDNVCKRILDDVALRLQNDPKARVVVIGYATPGTGKVGEKRAAKLASDRAANARKYLGEKSIAESRVEVRTGTGQKGAGKENSRTEFIWVPEGASY
jgi:outer membrane protein OmpA-like peptidoglycan-associated protein